jgi:hypothetical protein
MPVIRVQVCIRLRSIEVDGGGVKARMAISSIYLIKLKTL